MSWLSRSLRRSLLCLLWMLSPACVAPACDAQGKPQFTQPGVQPTGGSVASFLTGSFQQQSGLPDILYINARSLTGTSFQVTAGELLNQQGFTNLNENQIVFSNVVNVTAAVYDFDGDGITDYAFALSPTTTTGSDLCVYYGTGVAIGAGSSYSPLTAKSGCTSFPIQGGSVSLPNFAYIAALPFRTGTLAQLIVEDSANGYLYVIANSGEVGMNGALPGFTVKAKYALPPADGAGPIYVGDFNNDGNTDFIVNGQNGLSASVYFGNGDGTFKAPVRYTFDHNVHSMLMHDMDGDGVQDMVVEGDAGVIEIFKGKSDGSFAATSEGGTTPGLDGFSGNGGQLAAVGKLGADTNLDILTTTPIGLSVLEGQGNLTYKLKGIYNVGPGRSSYALADFNGDGNLDLAVNSPEGLAIVLGRSDASFATSSAYSAGQPALGATLSGFRNFKNNPNGNTDVAVATGATQAQLLTGNGDGTFNTFPTPANTLTTPIPTPANLWSAVLSGDFDGDGNQDLLYSLTGLPLPTPGASAGSGLYLQYGNGDGTFQPPVALSNQLLGAPPDNNFYGESAVADLNGDGISDIVNLDQLYYDTLLSQKSAGAFTLGLNLAEDASTNDTSDLDSFSQVAVGYFANGTGLGLVFQDDANITPYVNNNGVFTPKAPLSNTPSASQLYGGTILVADIDNDGNGDIIVPYHNLGSNPASPSPASPNQLYIWYGYGDGTFEAPVITTLSRNYYLAAVVDMNGDGLPDIVLSDGYLVAILYNQGNHTFGGEQHFLAGQGINSLSIADVNGDGALDLIVTNGGATISDAVVIGGLVPLSPGISLTPNPDVNTGGITVLLNNIKTKPVTGSLSSSPDPSEYRATFTMTASLTPTAGVAPPTGTVQFTIDGNPAGPAVPVMAGATSSSAAYTVPAGNTYATGVEHAITAAYSGDTLNSPVTIYGNQLIQGIPTTTTLDLCVGGTPGCPVNGVPTGLSYVPALTMYYGQVYNGVAGASANDGSTLDPTSSIALNDLYGGVTTLLCTLSIVPGSMCPANVGSGTQSGVNVFTAVYSGDATHQMSTSPPVTLTVLPDITSATLASSASPSPFGQPVTFTATLTGNYAPPTGPVLFSELVPLTGLSAPLGTGTLVPGTGLSSTATFITSTLAVGTDSITASYAATLNFLASSSAIFPQVITPLFATATTLTSSQNPSGAGQSVTFTATIAATGTSAPVPTGTVSFLDGGTPIGTGTLNAGVATFATSSLAVGSHNITASYPGATTTQPSVSQALVQVVVNTSFTITVTPTPVTVGVGRAATLTVTVTTANGFGQPVNLSCSNLPPEAACNFVNAVIAPAGGSTTLLVTTTAPHSCGSTQPYFLGGNGPGLLPGLLPLGAPLLAGLAMVFVPGRRRWLRALIAMVAVAGAFQLAGCGNCTDLGTRPNTYTIQVSASSTGTTEVESQSVTLNVTI